MTRNVHIYTPRLLSEGDIVGARSDIYTSFEGSGSPKEAVQVLCDFFLLPTIQLEDIRKFESTYWRWFVDISWMYLEDIKDEAQFSAVICHTAPYAMASGVNVLDRYLAYFRSRADEFPGIAGLHIRLGSAIVQSKMPIVLHQNKTGQVETVQDLVEFSIHMDSLDSLVLSERLGRIEQLCFSDSKNAVDLGLGTVTDHTDAIKNLLGLYTLCASIKDIEPSIREYFFDTLDQPTDHVDMDPKAFQIGYFNTILEEQGQPPITGDSLFYDFNLFEYIQEIAQQEKRDTTDTTYIIDILERLANLRREPRIRDVYYYNEATGSFDWDEALLKELELVPKDFDMSSVQKSDDQMTNDQSGK